ncbi:MAG: ATP-binding protein [Streptosporangiales bacterium]|nr:ATP-binding protein [Streptosporangiales bacterium]
MTGHAAARWTAEETPTTANQEWPWGLAPREEPVWRVGHLRPSHPYLGPSGASADATACALRPQPESVKVARDFARRTLGGWNMTALYDDLALVVSELVTNALRHAVLTCGEAREAQPEPCAATYPDPRRPIRLSLQRNGAHVVCAVTDPSDDIPQRRQPDHIAETGRGLHLVESFSRAWGWTPLAGRGKVVWALFSLGG